LAGRAADPIVGLWDRLAAPQGDPEPVNAAAVEALPEPARRWLNHAIAPGALAARGVLLQMTGHIKIGRWLPFTAVQVIAPSGYVWVARAGRGISIQGFDRYSDDTAEMRWLVAGRIPVLRARGPDIARGSAARLAIEALIWLPTAFGDARWQASDDPNVAVATRRVGREQLPMELRLDSDGRPEHVSMLRWANPNREPYGYHPFGGILDDETTFAGITIPTSVRVGYWLGSKRWNEGEFFRAQIIQATFL
jgi:hypothetical protein